MAGPRTFYQVLTEAVEAMATEGYTSAEQAAEWRRRLAEAADAQYGTSEEDAARFAEDMARRGLGAVWARLYDRGQLLKVAPGVQRYTLARVEPRLRAELDRAIAASADLIKLNKTEAVRKTLRRFSGWSTSVPPGGAAEADRRKIKSDIRKPLASLPFAERRVLIDQGMKLTSSLQRIVAIDNGAIAAEWHSSWRQRGYDYRLDHKERDGKIYLVRGCWALAKGLIKPSEAGYTDQITQPAEEVFCRCRYRYIYNLSQLPPEMLTEKGKAALLEARKTIAEGLGPR